MEDSELIPEKKSDLSFEQKEEQDKEKTINEPLEYPENVNVSENLINKESNNESISKNKNLNEKSIFNRILENGFDGITTNPNYKMLALLIILMVNLSLFFLIGNLGKSFLKGSGLLD